jgi:nucleotide-binding universal stress UspA family protein
MIRKILIAVAGLGKCEEMLNMLLEIPSVERASITLLHVVSAKSSAGDMAERLEKGGQILAAAVKILNLPPEQVNVRLRQGDPKNIVCEVADEEGSDLIIMGSRGLRGLKAVLDNSVSQYVFQLTSRPMLLIKDDIYVKRLNRIMVALDGSPAAKYCLDLAIFLAKDIKGAQLILSHVNPNTPVNDPEADPVLAPAITSAKQMGINYRCTTSSGKAGPEICRIAEEVNADLLIIGSPDRRPSIARGVVDLDRLLGNSQSDYVRVNAACPVLLARTIA